MMIDFMATPTRDFIPHDASRNLGTASSRSKPCRSKDSGYYPRWPSGFAAKARKTCLITALRLVK